MNVLAMCVEDPVGQWHAIIGWPDDSNVIFPLACGSSISKPDKIIKQKPTCAKCILAIKGYLHAHSYAQRT